MKKQSLLMTCLFASLAFTSCDKEAEVTVPQEANFTLDYTFTESGSMTRATGTEVYGDFYDNYIKTKVLTPRTYHLEFQSISNNTAILTIDGQWGTKGGIRLPEGEYYVVGYSRPIETYAKNFTYLPSDTVYISFNEKVSINKEMTTLTLNAKYDSYLLLFDYGNMSKIELNIGEKQLSHDNACYWVFAKENSWTNWDNGFSFTHYLSAKIVRKNGDNIDVEFGRLPLTPGKYYYFNDMTNTFDLPLMDSGN